MTGLSGPANNVPPTSLLDAVRYWTFEADERIPQEDPDPDLYLDAIASEQAVVTGIKDDLLDEVAVAGNGIFFSNNNAYLTLPSFGGGIPKNAPFTIHFYLYLPAPETFTDLIMGKFESFLMKAVYASSVCTLSISRTSDSGIEAPINLADNTGAGSLFQLPIPGWVQVIWTHDGVDAHSIYFKDILSGVTGVKAFTMTMANHQNALLIGTSADLSPLYGNFKLDSLGFWSRVINSGEIAWLQDNTASGLEYPWDSSQSILTGISFAYAFDGYTFTQDPPDPPVYLFDDVAAVQTGANVLKAAYTANGQASPIVTDGQSLRTAAAVVITGNYPAARAIGIATYIGASPLGIPGTPGAGNTAFTVQTLFKPIFINPGEAGTMLALGNGWQLIVDDSTHKLQLKLNGTAHTILEAAEFASGHYLHVVSTYSASGSHLVHVANLTSGLTKTVAIEQAFTSSGFIYVGATPTPSLTAYGNLHMDSLALWTRKLASAEVAYLFNRAVKQYPFIPA